MVVEWRNESRCTETDVATCPFDRIVLYRLNSLAPCHRLGGWACPSLQHDRLRRTSSGFNRGCVSSPIPTLGGRNRSMAPKPSEAIMTLTGNRHWFRSRLLLLLGGAALLTMSACMIFFVVLKSWEAPETGYRFPKLGNISSIRAVDVANHDHSKVQSFDIPRAYWSDVLASLSPSEADNPERKFEVIGRLRIQEANQEPVFVTLFWPESSGEFAIGLDPDGSDWKMFRGGSIKQLQRILARAYEKSSAMR